MVEWLSENIPVILGIFTFLGGVCAFAWKLTFNYIKLHYIPRKELMDMLQKLEKSFSDDLQKSSEAGIELSRFMNSQLHILQAAILNIKAPHDD